MEIGQKILIIAEVIEVRSLHSGEEVLKVKIAGRNNDIWVPGSEVKKEK